MIIWVSGRVANSFHHVNILFTSWDEEIETCSTPVVMNLQISSTNMLTVAAPVFISLFVNCATQLLFEGKTLLFYSFSYLFDLICRQETDAPFLPPKQSESVSTSNNANTPNDSWSRMMTPSFAASAETCLWCVVPSKNPSSWSNPGTKATKVRLTIARNVADGCFQRVPCTTASRIKFLELL